MTFPVDMVMSWVNPQDEAWRKEYESHSAGSREDASRVRVSVDLRENVRLLFKNCPWVNRLYLVLDERTEVPRWVSGYGRVSVVRHGEYIPAGLLPTYNSSVIDMFYSRIPGLSEHFVMLNDDMVFVNPCDVSTFFDREGRPTRLCRTIDVSRPGTLYMRKLRHNLDVYHGLYGGSGSVMYWTHLPAAYLRSVQLDFMDLHGDLLVSSCSMFRSVTNLCYMLFYHMQAVQGISVASADRRYGQYMEGGSWRMVRPYVSHGYKTLCINDAPGVDPSCFDKVNEILRGL